MSEEDSLHLYYRIISLASLILFSGEITLLYNYTVFRHARYGVIPTYPFIYSVKKKWSEPGSGSVIGTLDGLLVVSGA
jgi:hypothetical protein